MATSTQVKRRRGTQTQCEAMVPAEGEIIVDTSLDTLRVGDGLKSGGFVMPNSQNLMSNRYTFGVCAGSASAYTVALPLAPDSIGQGFGIEILVTNTNTGATTLAVNGGSPINIYKLSGGVGVPLDGGELMDGGIYRLVHDGTQLLIVSGYTAQNNKVTAGSFGISNTASRSYGPGSSTSLIGAGYTFYNPYDGTLRLNSTASATVGTATVRWYKNGAMVTNHTSASGSWTDDVAAAPGDTFQLYGLKSSSNAGSSFAFTGYISVAEYVASMAMV